MSNKSDVHEGVSELNELNVPPTRPIHYPSPELLVVILLISHKSLQNLYQNLFIFVH